MDDFRTVEQQVLRTPLGVRCVDSATQKMTPDGIRLTLCSLFAQNVGKVLASFATASGIFGFQDLGIYVPRQQTSPRVAMRDWERDDVIKIGGRNFLLCGTPRDNRFLEFCRIIESGLLTGDTDTATRQNRIVQWNCYSSSQRPPIAGMTAIRGRLMCMAGGKPAPAAFARVDAKYPDHADVAATGFSDEAGAFAVFLPLPSVQWTPDVNPKLEMSERGWNAVVTFQFKASKQIVYCLSERGLLEVQTGDKRAEIEAHRKAGRQCLPEIESLQEKQSAAKIVVGAASKDEQTVLISWCAENPIVGTITLAEIP